METAYIGIGSNMGDPRGNCLDAIDRIGRIEDCRIISVSDLYVTEPVGDREQEWYTNCVAAISTELPARDLLKRLLGIEADMGRVRTVKWGPRIIDLDILLYGQYLINDEDLKVPHPMMHMRRFVMAPMSDIANDLVHPVLGKAMIELLRELPENDQAVIRLEGI